MFSELAEKQEELSRLTGRLISVQEEERKRIAANIHDTLTQSLTAIGYKALLCQELQDRDPSRLTAELNGLVLSINEALKQSRQMISDLRPKVLDDLGIIAAFRRALLTFKEDAHIEVNLKSPAHMEVGSHAGIVFFRILQEALNNIKKHAQATKVDVMLTIVEENQVRLTIKDNGIGFNPHQINHGLTNSGLGLVTMRERVEDLGGRFEIATDNGVGCRITATVPL